MFGIPVRPGATRRLASLRGAIGTALALTLQIGTALPAAAAIYYVDNTNPACTNAGTGTAAAPYCSITSAANPHAGAGNTIMVMAGTYREQISVPGSGAAGSPFVFEAASPAVTVDGSDDFGSAAQWTLVSGNVWLASGVTWTPKQVFADGTRLTASTAAPASMPSRTFQYVAGTGLYVNAGGGSPAGHGTLVGHRLCGFSMSGRSYVTIRGFTATHCDDKGFLVQSASSNIEITDNRSSLSFKCGIQVNGSSACLIARNTVSESGGHGIALTAGSTGCTVENNESYLNADPSVRVANGLYLFGAPGNVIRGNRYHDNQDSGQHLQSASNNCSSIQNRSWRNGDHGFDHLGSTGTLHVGDVAWGNTMDGFSIEGSATGTQLYNCIAAENGLTTNEFNLWVENSSVAGFVSDYNLFWNSTAQPPIKYITTLYPTVAGYSTDSGQDANTIQADPMFTNPAAGNLRLLAGSPAIDNANSGAPSWPATDAGGLSRLDDPSSSNDGVGPVAYADRGALEFAPAVLRILPASGSSPLVVTADATGSLGPNGTVASYRFDFGDGSIAGPQSGPTAGHTYTTGTWTAMVTVTDQSGGTSTATAEVLVTASNVTPVDKRIAASSDDAEESSAGKSVVSGSDLDLVYDKSNQVVGMRWTGIAIPQYAFIDAAYIQFKARDSRTEATSLSIRGQAADNTATFTTANYNVSSRPRTAASVSWSPASWTRDQALAAQRTPDLSDMIEEIVNRPGWASGNALALIVTGTGRRVAYSYDGASASAPLLHIEYTPENPPVARLTVSQLASPALTVVADGSATTDTDPAPVASYRFTFGDGTPAVTTTVPSATAQHTYAAPGVYTVTLVATDTRGFASPAVTSSITVNAAPVARLSLRQLLNPPYTVSADASASTDPDPKPIASYRFDFGDGTPAVVTTVPNAIAQHTYAAGGARTVMLTVTDLGGLTSAPATASITLDSAPVARVSAAQVASPPLTVSADGSASTDGDATPIGSYRFDFGDGTAPVTTTAPTAIAQHAYAAGGNYTITLIATDTGGFASAPATAAVIVNGAPVARLSAAQIASPPLTVSADASTSTDPDPRPIASYRFDFGDGTPAVTTTAPNAVAQHAYAAAGSYTVSVLVTDTGGLTSTATAAVFVDAAPVARLAVTVAASPALTVNADGTASTDSDATAITSYRFDFGDGTAAVTTNAPSATAQHTYAAPGTYTVTLVATDAGGYASAPATASVTVLLMGSVDRRVASGTDDAEEPTGAKTVTNSNDLEFVFETSLQTVGMRWTGVTIPRGATITKAYIQFAAKEAQSEATSLTIRAQASDNPSGFNTQSGNITNRTRTTSSVSWAPVVWAVGDAGANQRTPELKTVIQEIVNRSGWASGNALVIIVNGTGHRTAWSYNGNSSLAPLLHVEYSPLPPTNTAPVARLSAAQLPSPALTVQADGSASTDSDAWPIASYRFDFGDGTAAVTTTAPTAVAQHTYAAAGTYTVRLVVTDTGGLASTETTASITVTSGTPPTARLTVAPAASPPLAVTANGSTSTTGSSPIASYRFTFGDGTAAVTTTAPTSSASHTYAAAGTYTVTLTVTDTGARTSPPATASITVGGGGSTSGTIDLRIAAWLDDVEEGTSGTIYVNSSDLELITDGSSTQKVGVRWPGLAIPRGATITSAYIQFAAKEAQSEATSLSIRAEASDNAAAFGSSTGNLSARTLGAAAASWSPVAWAAGEAGANQRTPELKSLIQEVVNRPAWASGNAIAFIVSGTGHRTAWANDGNAAAAPLLHVDYTGGSALVAGAAAAAAAEHGAFAEPEAAMPRALELSLPRPNPAAGPVSFRLELPRQARVHWGIYDIQGRALWSEDRMFEPGRVDLSWNGITSDGSRAGSGLYFARVHADNKVLVRRFVRL